AVERPLHFHEPDDAPDQRKKEPEPSRSAYRARLPVEVLVHVADLGRDDEVGNGRDNEIDDEPDNAANPVPGIALDLLMGPVDPDERIDPERQYCPKDREPDRTRVANGATFSLA